MSPCHGSLLFPLMLKYLQPHGQLLKSLPGDQNYKDVCWLITVTMKTFLQRMKSKQDVSLAGEENKTCSCPGIPQIFLWSPRQNSSYLKNPQMIVMATNMMNSIWCQRLRSVMSETWVYQYGWAFCWAAGKRLLGSNALSTRQCGTGGEQQWL